MKSLDKFPTNENLDKVAKNDVLDRNFFISNFIRLLASIEGNYSIALDGRWGAGKTFFVKQTERVIRQLFRYKKEFNQYYKVEANLDLCKVFEKLFNMDEVKSHPMMTLYYDAWQHDNQQDALLSLVFEIVKLLPSDDPRLKTELSTGQKIQKTIVPIAQGILNHLIGLDLKAIQAEFNDPKSDILLKIRDQENLNSLLNDFFKNILPIDNTRLVIFIDELDRCKPDYAVQLLERIKHYMISDRITFVFSVNLHQLQHTIKRFYGDDFEATSYLDRFFNLHINLPSPDLFKRRETLIFGPKESIFNEWCQKIIDEFHFENREIIHFKQLIKQTIYTYDSYFRQYKSHAFEHDKVAGTLAFLNFYFAPLALAYLIKDINLYYEFIDGKNEQLIDILLKHISSIALDHIYEIFNQDKNWSYSAVESTIKESFHKLYKLVFSDIYILTGESNEIGKLFVNGEIKQQFINQLSFLNGINDYQSSDQD